MNTYLTYGIIFVILLVLELVYFKIADKLNIIDKPNERSSHSTIVLRGGGIIFLLGAWVWALKGFMVLALASVTECRADGLGFMDSTGSPELDCYPFFLIGLTLVAGVSFIDDIHSLPDSVRLVAQFAAMGLMFYQLGMFTADMWWMIIPALIVCVGASNVINFMDGVNGITGAYAMAVLVPLLLLNTSTPLSTSCGDFETKTIKTPEAATSISMCENPSDTSTGSVQRLDSSPTETSVTVFNGSEASSGKKQEKTGFCDEGTGLFPDDVANPDKSGDMNGGNDLRACSQGISDVQSTMSDSESNNGRGFSVFVLIKKAASLTKVW